VSSYTNDFESGEELATWQFAISAPVKQMLTPHSREMQKAAWQAVGRLLSAALSVFACLNAMLAIVYSHRPTADPNLAQQNHDLWTEAAFFAALCVVAALLVVSARRLLIVAAAIVLFLLGLVALGDIVNARKLTASDIGLVFLIGSLAGASVALLATVLVLLRRTARHPSSWR